VLFRPPGGEQERIVQSPAGDACDGWRYSDDRSRVLLCGSTCDRVSSSTGQLSIEFGCSTDTSLF
jgi:hypothetical protein